MDIGALFVRYFGTEDVESVDPATLQSGLERLHVDFGLEKDSGRRFGLWTLMYMFGTAPDIDVAFADEEDREAARDFMDAVDNAED